MSTETSELIVRGKNLTGDMFAAVTGNVQKLGTEVGKANTGNSFGRMESSLRQFDDVLELAGGPHLRDLIQGVGQLGDVASGASGQLGGLAKAGLVASAAFGGWQIGRKIAELTGSDTIIGNITSKVLGWGDASKEAANAGLDVLARASRTAGRDITDMAEAVRINEAATNKMIDTTRRLGAAATSTSILAGWKQEIADLKSSGVLEGLKKDLESQNFSQKDLADRYRVSSDAVALFNRQLQDQKKSLDTATKATNDHVEAIKKIADGYRGVDTVKAATDAVEAFHQGQRDGLTIEKMSRDAIIALNKVMSDAIDVYRRSGQAIPEEWVRIANATALASQQGVADMTSLVQVMQDLEHTAVTLPASILPSLAAINKGFAGLDLGALGTKVEITPPNVSKMFQIFGTSQDFGRQMSATILGAIQGGGNPIAAASGQVGNAIGSHIAKELTTKGGAYLTGALGGMVSAVLPGLGTIVGPLVGKLASMIGGLFNRDAGRDAVKEWAQGITGSSDLNALHVYLQKALDPAQAEAFWKALTQDKGVHDNAQRAKTLIDEVNAAIDAQAKKRTANADAAEEEAARVTAAQQAVLDGLTKQIDGIDREMESLQQSIANEAPEKEIGLVQRATQERIDDLAKQRKQLQTEMEAAQQATTDAVADTAEGVDGVNDKATETALTFERWVRAIRDAGDGLGGLSFPPFGGSSSMPSHDSGAFVRMDHVARVHAGELIGPVDFMAEALAGALARVGASSGGAEWVPAAMHMDGMRVGEVVFKRQHEFLSRYRVRRS